MAGSASDYLENKILNHIVGKTSFTMPTAYVALLLGAPGEANSGAGIQEVAASNSYARKATAGADWNDASGGSISNANAITFTQASGTWGTVTHFALMTSPVRGEGYMLMWGSLGTSKLIENGDTPSFAAGQLTLTAD